MVIQIYLCIVFINLKYQYYVNYDNFIYHPDLLLLYLAFFIVHLRLICMDWEIISRFIMGIRYDCILGMFGWA